MLRPATGSIFTNIAEVTDSLYLCAARSINQQALQQRGVTCVVNATTELPNLPVSDVEFLKVAVEDSPFANLGAHFDKVADKIHEIKKAGGKTLVHCMAGVSRSASLCIAYLMKYEHLTLRDAYQHVKEKRAIIRPNNGFFRQLIEYEQKLCGRETVTLVSTSFGMIPDVYEHDYRNLMMISARSAAATMALKSLPVGQL